MTDKEILHEVYHRLQKQSFTDTTVDRLFDRWHDIKDFIEQEWQREDDSRQQSKALGQFSKTWYEVDARRENDRHRGLEIEPDGTVTEVK